MKRKHYLPAAALLLLTATNGFAQAYIGFAPYMDAARFGMLIPQGTARSIGFGSALGSVGGDFSSLSVNPAGIGIYRRGELSFSPALHFGETDFTYLGQKSTDNFGAFNISNIGLVSVAGPRGNEGRGWRSWGFGIGLNRVADFNRSYNYTGRNDSSAFSEAFYLDALTQLQNGNSTLDEQSLGNLGYQTYLVNYDSASNSFYPAADYRYGPLRQRKSVQERGGINELAVSVGGNYEEKVMVGATVGVPFLRYKRTMNFTETDANGTIPDFQQASYQQELATTGVGVNLKLGVIIKPSNAFRFGAAIHTPTWYALRDQEDNSLSTNTDGTYPNNSSFALTTRTFEYNMRTPWRAVLSATGFLENWGFLSADYEYVDYASSRITLNTSQNQILYGTSDFALQQQMANDSIKSNLKGASNFRIGFESRLDVLYLRAGLGFYGSPFKNSLFGDGTRTYQVGIGYRGKSAFADLGFMNTQAQTGEYAYQLPYEKPIMPEARGNLQKSSLVLTFGVKF